MHVDERALETLILDSGLLSRADMAELKARAGEKGMSLGNAALSQGFLRENDLRRMEAYLLGLPFVDLKNRQVDFAIFSLIPEPVARNHNVIAFGREADGLEVALLDIADLSALDFLRRRGLRLMPRLTDTESMKWALRSYQGLLKSEFGDRIHEEVAKLKEDDAIAPGLAEALLKHALIQSTTDIHIEPGDDHSLVRYRIGSLLRDAMILPKRAVRAVARTMRELAGGKDKETLREGRFRIEANGDSVLCRFSLLPVEGGERITIRVVRGHSHGFTLEGLGLDAAAVEDLHQGLFSGPGLVLAAGPARSGKTTTLYTMLDLLNTPERNIVTLEDEIEARLPRVGQARLSPNEGFTYAHGLRTLLQQDPDVIMVSNVPNEETARLLSHAAEHHLVLAGLEAETPEAALARFASPKMLVFHAPPALGGVRRLVIRP